MFGKTRAGALVPQPSSRRGDVCLSAPLSTLLPPWRTLGSRSGPGMGEGFLGRWDRADVPACPGAQIALGRGPCS